MWRQKINPGKCEAILFRSPLRKGPRNFIRNWKDFTVCVGGTILPGATAVQYLGVHLENTFNFNKHVWLQLKKARSVTHALSRIFFSRHVSDKVKLVCYLAIIRPVLTYGCPIWYCIDPSTMEDLRRLERRCLRYCLLRSSRTAESNFIRYVDNQQLYKNAGIPRIDNHMIALIRNHCARTSAAVENSLMNHPLLSVSGGYIRRCMVSGILPPEAFIYLDAKGYIQVRNGIPAIYHVIRNYPKERIAHEPCADCLAVPPIAPISFNTDVPERDKVAAQLVHHNYWWKKDGGGFG